MTGKNTLVVPITMEVKGKLQKIAVEVITLLREQHKLTPFECLVLLNQMLASLEETIQETEGIINYEIVEKENGKVAA